MLLLLALLLGACATVDDHLTIAADGSWTVVIEARTPLTRAESIALWRVSQQMGEQHIIYPPLGLASGRKLFDGLAVEVEGAELPADGELPAGFRVEIRGTDLAQLMASDYAELRQLNLRLDGDELVLSARDPMHRLLVLHAIGAMPDDVEDDEMGMLGWMKPQLKASLRHQHAWRSVQRVTLPGLRAAEGAALEAGTAIWSRGPEGEDPAAAQVLLRPMVARAAPLTVEPPAAALRPGSLPFAQVPTETGGAAIQQHDEETVREAAQFLPVRLQVSRRFQYSSEQSHSGNDSSLSFALLLPEALAPRSIASPQVLAVKAGGQDLLPRHQYNQSIQQREEALEDGRRAFVGSVRFDMPPREATRLENLEVELQLTYPGVPRLVVLPAAIAADGIRESSSDMSWSSDDPSIPSPALESMGLAMTALSASKSSLGLSLQFMITGPGSELLGLQVFDAAGQPWPTLGQPGYGGMHGGSGDRIWGHFLVLGNPQPPLSLVLHIDGGGQQLRLRHLFTDLPFQPEQPAQSETQEQP